MIKEMFILFQCRAYQKYKLYLLRTSEKLQDGLWIKRSGNQCVILMLLFFKASYCK